MKILLRCAGGLMNLTKPALLYLDGAEARERVGSDGQTFVEYAMILSLIAVVLIFALGVLGGQVGDAFRTVSNVL